MNGIMELRCVVLRGLSVYAVMVYTDSVLQDVCFSSVRLRSHAASDQQKEGIAKVVSQGFANYNLDNGLQALWEKNPNSRLWESLVIDVAERIVISPQVYHEVVATSPPTNRFQKLAALLRAGASKAPSQYTSALGFDPLKPGGHGQEPEAMSAEELERIRKTGAPLSERNWNEAFSRSLSAKIDDPLE